MALFRYPREALHETTDYLRIDILKRRGNRQGGLVRTNAAFTSGTLQPQNYKTLTNSIILPIPSNIQDGNSVDYSDASLDGLTAQVFSAIKITGEIKTFKQVTDKLTDVLEKTGDVITGDDSRKVLTKSIAAEAANMPFGGNLTVNQILARESSEILNPNMELLFNGVNLRSFKFSFKMTPRDDTEAKEIRSIFKTLKTEMAPGGSRGDIFLTTPNVFQLSYRKGPDIHPYLNLFKQCFLTDMTVNYTAEGVYATYSDGSPVSYTLDLGFKEIEPVYRGDYSTATSENTVGF